VLNGWATGAPMAGRSLVEDFTLHWALQSACNGANARVLDGAGFTAWRPDLACTFVDNPDTDTSPGQQVISNKLLAYAFLLSIEGYPFVYAKDYFGGKVWPGAYGLRQWIDNLVWIHEHLANGPTMTRFIDDKVIVLNRTGAPGLLTALNFDSWSARRITCATSFGPNTQLHDYTGRHGDIWTDAEGAATFTVPSNAFSSGQSYLCFSRAGLDAPNRVSPRATTQSIFGAPDLDVMPAVNTKATAARITAQRGSNLKLTVRPNRTGWQAGTVLQLTVIDAHGHAVINLACSGETSTAEGKAGAGEHQITVGGRQLPQRGSSFEIDVTYTAPQTV
jgi:alpha-amylase